MQKPINKVVPESVSMKAEASENAGAHRRLRCFMPALPGELRGIVIPTDNALAEAFRASEGLNAPRIQVVYNHLREWDQQK
jgi:hypothetical protein